MKKILIVDDASMVLKILDVALSIEDYHVEQASSGEKAIELLEKECFDFGIFDYNMPGMTGIELLKKALSMPNGEDMQIIMLTTESDENLKEQAREAGASAWLIKPFKNDELIDLLEQLPEED